MARSIVLIPMYNELKTIHDVLARTYPHADLLVVVDDASTDGCGQVVSDFAEHHPGVQLLTLRVNQGAAGAMLAGFYYMHHLLRKGVLDQSDVLVNIDADGQHIPEEIPGALQAMQELQVDVLLGRRSLDVYPWYKWVGNWGLSLWASLLTGYRYYDVECGFRLMRLFAMEDMLPFFTGRRYSCGQEIGIITARRGWKINNRLRTNIPYYRHGARVSDGVTALLLGLEAFWRVTVGQTYSVPERQAEIFALLSEPVDETVSLAPWAASF